MTNQDQSCLRFSLEESIWFPKGQEVGALYSLSIEPNVTISERNQYIVIEGTLQVTGEYQGMNDHVNWENEYNPLVHQRYIQNILYREEQGDYIFHHTFPVDISIPTNRVEDRNAIEVDISSFDYNMPESSCIKLMAELMITGIYDGQQARYATEKMPMVDPGTYYEYPFSQESISPAPLESSYYQEAERFDESADESLHLQNEEARESSFISKARYEAQESSIIQQEKYEEAESVMNQRAGYEARESSIIQQEKYEEAESTMNPQMGYGEQPSAPLGVEQESLAVPQERDADYESTTLSSDDHIDQKLPYLQTEYYSEQESAVQSVSLDESESIAPRAVQNEEETGESTVQSEAALLQVESEYESFEVSAYALPREESAERQEPMAPELPAFDHKPFSFQSHFAIPMPIFTPPDIPDYPDIVGADARNEEVQEPAAAEIEVESSYQTFNYSLEEAEEVSVRSSKNESGPVIAKQEERPAASVEPEEPPQQPVESAPLNRPIYKVAEVESEEKRPLAETGKLSVSLTDFFAKKETQTKTKLKVCIVQNGENLSDLAARYEINKQDIIAYNHLEDESEVQGGKVLYIPQKAGHK